MADPRFKELCDRLWATHQAKSNDYGTDADPFANYNRGKTVGVDGWRSAAARMVEKWQRIENYCQGVMLETDSFEDALIDNAAHSLITLLMWRDSQVKSAPAEPAPVSAERIECQSCGTWIQANEQSCYACGVGVVRECPTCG